MLIALALLAGPLLVAGTFLLTRGDEIVDQRDLAGVSVGQVRLLRDRHSVHGVHGMPSESQET